MMKLKFLLVILFSLSLINSNAQNNLLSKQQVKVDLAVLKKSLNQSSSYVYLNGYDFNIDVEAYLEKIKEPIKLEDFGLFLTKTIGKIGDRHASVSGYRLNDTLFLPFSYAPENNKVVVLKRNGEQSFEILNEKFPYLKKVNGMAVEDFLQQILPSDVKAPKNSYFTRAVRELRDIQKDYNVLGKDLPNEIQLIISDRSSQRDTAVVVSPVGRTKRSTYWDEKFEREYFLVKDEDYNKPEIVKQLFDVKEQIGYIRVPVMVSKADAPYMFEQLNSFMKAIQNNSEALIVDVRSNGGGTRDLIYELAKYFIHPDSIYVVNATKQRAKMPLAAAYKESLHSRNLFSFSELDKEEQERAKQFLTSFNPQYNLDSKKYSEYYFGLLNGKKLSKGAYYNKPIYILTNEKSFSAASVLVAVFKGIPNINIVGTITDGSSGNSERFELPNSKLKLKISTMVSFQKDGKILDGYGTEPDITINRHINQILWKSDTQLEQLRSLILNKIAAKF